MSRPAFTSLGIEISADRHAVWIALAGERDGVVVVELLDPVDPFKIDFLEEIDKIDWLEEIVNMVSIHPITSVVVNPTGNGATLVDPLKQRGVPLLLPDASGMVKAWGIFHDRTVAGTLKHRGHRDLTEAMRLAVGRRTVAGAQQVDRRAVKDPAPLVAAELAVYGLAAAVVPQLHVWSRDDDGVGW